MSRSVAGSRGLISVNLQKSDIELPKSDIDLSPKDVRDEASWGFGTKSFEEQHSFKRKTWLFSDT